MWSPESGKDPGGPSASGAPQQSSQELADLKDQFEQQQVLIHQLKEMLRKTEQTNVSQERVEEMASTLSKMNARAKRSKLKREGEGERPDTGGARRQIDTPAKEKINLLRQQLEENKVKLAERGKSQKDIEEMVIQLKAQLDDSQNLINQSPLNLSLAEPKVDSYGPETSSQELYRVLLMKEKRVSELLTKVQKLEGTVLDLQENVKEKDQVIDARTKAITLMSENLSKKGKHTLDMLDETKEQMRKMQENFVQVESDMRAEKQKLLRELEEKDKEIAELRGTNSELEAEKSRLQGEEVEKYKREINELNEKIAEMEKSPQKSRKGSKKGDRVPQKDSVDNRVTELQSLLDETKDENSKLTNEIEELNKKISELEAAPKSEEGENDAEEMQKLKKQLDESNKNMIKVKAQHKSKIKELTKKIEAFKSASDSNAEIARLEAENAKLNNKVDELERERDSLLLQLGQSDSNRERVVELEEKIKGLSELLGQKEKEIEELKQKTDVSADQVASAIDSITFEEQLDKLEADKRLILQEKHDAIQENKDLLEKLESLRTEKHETALKLEQYMQENMDLIDKLEKLSAEKVSSAESIEIVEGLTQQETLELEAYQKHAELMKSSRENLEQNAELNESVNQLTEETSELLQKIELFTVERREVMEKMEALAQENAQLASQAKEIENNRDVLAETYEQLQNEKEELDRRLQRLEDEQKAVQEDNDELRKRISDIDGELARKNLENANLETIINEAKTEAIASASTINGLQRDLTDSQNEIVHLNSMINDLNEAMNKLENENRNMVGNNEAVEVLEKQLGELKTLLKDNIEQAQIYEAEIEENSKTIEELKMELNRMNESLLHMEHALHSKDDEIKKLLKDKANLQEEVKAKNESFHVAFEELKGKCQKMAAQIDQNSGSIENTRKPLEEKIRDLTNKNREQLEKMKKIAANLKKKSAAYQELEEKYLEVKEKWETENKEKEDLKGALESKDLQIVELNQKINSLVQQLHEVEDELSSLQNRLTQKQKEHDSLLEEFNTFKESRMVENDATKAKENVVEELRNSLRQYENQIAALVTENEMLRSQQHNVLNSEIHSKEQEIARLREQLQTSSTHSNGLEANIRELEMFVENQEAELAKYKERVNRLEEGLNAAEERRLALEEHALELGAQLQEKSSSLEEISQTEDELEKRLHALVEKDEAIRRRLQETLEENRELTRWNRELQEENAELRSKVAVAQNRVAELGSDAERWAGVEEENRKLKERVQEVEGHLKHLQAELNEKRKELESQEGDLQEQLKKSNEERRAVFEQMEREVSEKGLEIVGLQEKVNSLAHDLNEVGNELELSLDENRAQTERLKEYKEQEVRLNEELLRFKERVDELEVKLEGYEKENVRRIKELEGDVQKLNEAILQQNQELEYYKAQPRSEQSEDTQKLRQVIVEKEKEIEEYQKQNLQLQMQSAQFNLTPAEPKSQLEAATKRIAELEEIEARCRGELAENQRKINSLEDQLKALKQNEPPQIATFAWPQEAEDPFSFVAETAQQQANTAEELQNKVKTLEFMLFSVEKEKDEAVMQCHQLSNELTRLVYEREQAPKADLASQILKPEDLLDTPQSAGVLRDLEFEPTKTLQQAPSSVPVVEDVLTPETAYLCYPDDKSVAGQVVKPDDLKETAESRQRLHDLEFEKVKTPVEKAHSSKPVEEEKLQAKSAYLCYAPGKSEAVGLDAFGENDDGWAWGPEEAKLEEEHRTQTEAAPQAELLERVKVLELEREHHLEEIRQAQVKSGKLIKKLKELKAKNEQLSSQLAVQSSGLDDAIQDEFKLQIEGLDRKVKELAADLAKERLEKENLKKRIDVLTAAHERMLEMKERQEVEILSWKQRSRELESKLEQFDWGGDGFERSSKSVEKRDDPPATNAGDGNLDQLQQRIHELNETVRELSLDNEELQALLEEQRNLRINAEKPKYAAETLENLLVEKENLNRQLLTTTEEKKKLQEELNVVIQKNDALAAELQNLSRDNRKMQQLSLEKKELERKFEDVKREYDGLIRESVEFGREVLDRLRVAEEENDKMKQQSLTSDEINTINEEKASLTSQLARTEAEISTLRTNFDHQLSTLKREMDEQNRTILELQTENARFASQIREKEEELRKADEKYATSTAEFEQKLSTTVEELTREWMQQVDRRGSDVAESWKLHLDTRENEFMQLEQHLRKEISELQNENNELRKNVDAEIRNEVDRVAALQRQINELNAALQEKQDVIEALRGQLVQLQTRLQGEELKVTDYETTLVIKDEEIARNQELIGQLGDKLTNQESHVKAELLHQAEDRASELQRRLEESETKLQNALAQSGAIAEDCQLKVKQLEVLQRELEVKDGSVGDLNRKLSELQGKYDSDYENVAELRRQLAESQNQIVELNGLVQEKQNYLEYLNNELQSAQQLIQNHESAINRMNAYVEEVKRQSAQELSSKSIELEHLLDEKMQEINAINRKLTETVAHYEEALTSKDGELEGLRIQLEEQAKSVNEKTAECEELNSNLNALDDEQQKQTAELHTIIEDQVLRIEDLKNELFAKSNDYDALIAELDMRRHPVVEKQPEAAAPSVYHETEEDNLLEPVSRAELDLALYMLHQRDVRCEELTMELMQLLEERDTLQLRLSNALREKEELARGGHAEASPAQQATPTGAVPKGRASAIVLGATGTELATEGLAHKLSELKTVGYDKDKTLVDEKELRRLQQLSIMQQHKDIAAKLPPEAAQRLVDANYTLSRDVQSPSKVLLNWLWGRSTPKVNDV